MTSLRPAAPATDPPPELRDLATALLASVEASGAVVARRVRERIPFYAESGAVTEADLVASCVENLRFVIEGLAAGQIGDPAPAAATGTGRALAGVPLPAVLAAYRVGFGAMWEQVAAEARDRGIPAEVVLATTADAMVMHDVFTETMAAAYNATVTERVLREEAERSSLVETVLSGTVVDRRTLWEVADLLGLPVSGTYVVVAALLAAPGRASLAGVEPALARLGCRSAWRLLPQVQVGIVDVGTTSVERVVEALTVDGRARIGVSPVVDDLTGAARALELARLAAATAPAAGGAVRFGEDPVGIAAAAGGDVVARMADDILGPLDGLAEADRYSLVETLEVWVEVGGSASKTAQRLSCHANTVRHRLRRFEERTGRRLDRPRDVAALCLALEALRSRRS
ncbi:PucR family transcriptional regulator [Nocardioides kongjuensis]|uniref:PucR family transcriptional regulator n=1 Tax=Nocardioides kongjuensis TaxID=349522 RepID=A0A852RHI4_9ACTN|nr:helix-turn-helix domain-containing protein [Nocardioides kongjuensis]NYD30148.1 hypothetical protein [Nocardioides kongjuensis]